MCSVILKQKWIDNRLEWNLDDYKGVEYLHIPIDKLWQPDIILYNNIDGNFYPSLNDVPALVEHNGTVHWNPPSIYTASCNIQVRQFPYDIQRCTMLFKSMTYNYPEIALMPAHEKVWTGHIQPHIEWELTEATVREHVIQEWQPSGDQEIIFLAYTFYMSRLPLYYTTYVIAPTIAITGLVIVVFHLPNIGGEKITLSISVLLALTFFLTLVSGITPTASFQVPLISKYLLFSMTLVACSIVSSVCVANIHHRSPQIHVFPKWCRHVFLEVLPRYLLMKRPKKDTPTFPYGYR